MPCARGNRPAETVAKDQTHRKGRTRFHSTLAVVPSHTQTDLVDGLEGRALGGAGRCRSRIDRGSHQSRHRDSFHVPPLPTRSGMTRCRPRLDRRELQAKSSPWRSPPTIITASIALWRRSRRLPPRPDVAGALFRGSTWELSFARSAFIETDRVSTSTMAEPYRSCSAC